MYRTGQRRNSRVLCGMVGRLRRSDDSGATLILALIFITVVSVVVAGILSFVDTSMRTTVAVRDQASRAAAADGAAQLAINAVRNSTFVNAAGTKCLDTGSLNLPGFYQSGASTYSATVACDPDTTDSVRGGSGAITIAGGNRPGQAVLTLGGNSADGLDVTLGGNDVLTVHGNVYSNANITAQKNLTSDADITAVGTCSASGTMRSATGTLTSTPKGPKCGGGVTPADDPDYPAPPAPTTARSVPGCPTTGKTIKFSPGLYTDLDGLNTITAGKGGGKKSGCPDVTFWFQPGVYYFSLGGEWDIPGTVRVVGGTPRTGVNLDNPTFPKTCQAPIPDEGQDPKTWTPPSPNAGVEFVFGGATNMVLGTGAQMELCGTYDRNVPPIVLYGLKTTIGSGALSVPGEATTDCVRRLSTDSGSCPILDTAKHPGSASYFQGTVYVPYGWANVELNNSAGQMFRFGIIARKLSVTATSSADLTGSVIGTPDEVYSGPGLAMLALTVYVCPGTTTCPATGPALKVKVGVADPNGDPVAGKRQVTIYNWSVQRT